MPILTTLAADSKMHTRGRAESLFKGCLGVCLLSDGLDDVKRAYEDYISTTFSSIPRSRYVYKASSIREKLSLSSPVSFIKVLGDFYSSLLSIERLYIVILYTTFNTQKLPHVTYMVIKERHNKLLRR